MHSWVGYKKLFRCASLCVISCFLPESLKLRGFGRVATTAENSAVNCPIFGDGFNETCRRKKTCKHHPQNLEKHMTNQNISKYEQSLAIDFHQTTTFRSTLAKFSLAPSVPWACVCSVGNAMPLGRPWVPEFQSPRSMKLRQRSRGAGDYGEVGWIGRFKRLDGDGKKIRTMSFVR
jgi:hypothetical protein